MIAGRGDKLPTSAMPEGGVYPTGTTQYEKRNIAIMVPQWDPNTCIPVRFLLARLPACCHPHQSV